MKLRAISLAGILAILSPFSLAQDPEIIGLPEFGYSWMQTDDLKVSANFHTFHSVSNIDQSSSLRYFESALIATYSGNSNFKIGGGYKYRIVTPFVDGYQYEHRFLEQVEFSNVLFGLQMSNRFRIEQRFRTNNYVNRIRYRLQHKLPLSDSEKTLKLYDEFHTSFNSEESSGENRVYIGVTMSAGNGDFEFGLQHRLQKLFTDADTKQVFVFYTKFSLSR